jgi:hypothetical protein
MSLGHSKESGREIRLIKEDEGAHCILPYGCHNNDFTAARMTRH